MTKKFTYDDAVALSMRLGIPNSHRATEGFCQKCKASLFDQYGGAAGIRDIILPYLKADKQARVRCKACNYVSIWK